ncbi:MAG: FliI/YscN family ATPase [Firmicutes bacterium]|nr:FliI/YscN family ATPase [Bacillota bacterium]
MFHGLTREGGLSWDGWFQAVAACDPYAYRGRVSKVVGLTIESLGPKARLGELCTVLAENGREIKAEVVGFRGNSVLLLPLGEMRSISPGAEVLASGESFTVPVGPDMLGRVLDGLGRPIDGQGSTAVEERRPVEASGPSPLDRVRITQRLGVGVRAVDALLTCGRGQRIGIFSGSGVGKSTLLGMIARHTEADVAVIALVGERGREVKDFLERDLGPEGLARSVVVAATSDRPAMERVKAAQVATALAEFYRDRGLDVLLLMDSLTRFAMALREVGLAAGEPPTARGYTPSVFGQLPRLLERAGRTGEGSITGFYTVLVEGDDPGEPISDAVRGLLDGHIFLSRDLASRNHYPAVDVLGSVSRLMRDLVTPEHRERAGWVRRILATYREAEDLINIGAYVEGANPEIDLARANHGAVMDLLRQPPEDGATFEDTLHLLGLLSKGRKGEAQP